MPSKVPKSSSPPTQDHVEDVRSREARTHIIVHVVFQARPSHVVMVKGECERVEGEGRGGGEGEVSHLLLWRRVSAGPTGVVGCPGTFSRSVVYHERHEALCV